ncbi:hypothetical protein ANCCAN_01335 [Ancylostoma caninum]|uniref:Uncharacterized protein n=1 Tax=Ancylostoma caninum TaxID=29170 RepID=A0A368H7S7_ANCCA|nr:hypothetical protein ANCCAN_01335 [Ancylostoma caninum]
MQNDFTHTHCYRRAEQLRFTRLVFHIFQLTRLSTSLSDFFDVLARDQKHFDSERSVSSPTVAVLVAIKQARASILLTMGPMPSPYDNCPAVTESVLECLSERRHSFK